MVSQKMGRWFSLCVAYMLLCLCSSHAPPVLCQQNETDRLALVAFKEGIHQDPLRVFSSWNESLHYCAWYGVVCGRGHPERVVALKLSSQGLAGSLSPHIGNLSFVRYISLQHNSFYGQIPQEIGHLFRLQVLSLGNNSFEGHIPASLSRCTSLVSVDLSDNKLVGGIPAELGSLMKLTKLVLAKNSLTGTIPDSLGNLSSLVTIYVAANDLQGPIPDTLSQLWSLRSFNLSENHLTGKIPDGLFNISSIEILRLDSNRLNGSIPSDIGLKLPKLRTLTIAENRFTGFIPLTLSNASRFEEIDFGANYFRGTIPKDLGRLPLLEYLMLSGNELQDDFSFIDSITNCSGLIVLGAAGNLLSGKIPKSIGNLSADLEYLSLSRNKLYGTIPPEFENLSGLRLWYLHTNFLSGPININFTRFQKLQVLNFQRNNLTGPVRSSFGSLALLSYLQLSDNNLHGSIPPSLGTCRSLTYLDLSCNNFDGEIPRELLNRPSLSRMLNLSSNRLIGSLPSRFGLLENLGILDVTNNRLTGKIPDSIPMFSSVEELYLGGNNFEGEIPEALSVLKGLQVLDISRNNLSGKIPEFLSMLPGLYRLNLSFNRFEGEVPRHGIFLNASRISVSGNVGLCGGTIELQLPACPSPSPSYRSLLRTLIPIVAAVALLSMAFYFVCCWRKLFKKRVISLPSFNYKILRISYAELLRATDGFSETNTIGNGSYGSVYKGTLDQVETVVAVKVLNLHQRGASRSFMSECGALGSIRHRNLLKLLSACSSVDFQGNDFKALIYEFMANGSLEKWLHGEEEGVVSAEGHQHEESRRSLRLIQRLDIAIDIASAIEYLHNGCSSTIIHGDLKPSNVLLDDEMVAHVGDFGLAKVVSAIPDEDHKNPSSSMAFKGSIGYVPPEYGIGGRASTEGDVYSYGIILLEMFTGKRPTSPCFKDGLNLHTIVGKALPHQVMEIADHSIPPEGGRYQFEECLLSVMRIGVKCSMELPEDRMVMKDVINELYNIKSIYKKKDHRNAYYSGGPSTPYM